MYNELHTIQNTLESHYKEMQDIEFTIENQKLWILQTRKGKRNGVATIKIALDMYKEKIITKNDLLRKIKPKHVNEMLYQLYAMLMMLIIEVLHYVAN